MYPRAVVAHDSSTSRARFAYLPQLDGLRCVAVLAVVAAHAQIPHFAGGGVGVDVFFVISGFIITSLLMREWAAGQAIAIKKFYLRRAGRLFPALLVAVVVSAVLFAVIRPYHTSPTYLGMLTSLFYASGWVRGLG